MRVMPAPGITRTSKPRPMMFREVSHWHVGVMPCRGSQGTTYGHLTPSMCACRWYLDEDEARAALQVLQAGIQLALW